MHQTYKQQITFLFCVKYNRNGAVLLLCDYSQLGLMPLPLCYSHYYTNRIVFMKAYGYCDNVRVYLYVCGN